MDVARSRPTAALSLALAAAVTTVTAGGAAGATGASPAGNALVRVVLSGTSGAADAAREAVRVGGRVLRELPLVGSVAVDLPRAAVLAPGYRAVPDRSMTVSGLDSTTGSVTSTVRATLGLGSHAPTGAGVTVAVVDTGVADVPDLAGRITHVDVTGTATPGAPDGYGHGTFVAGLIAGDGANSAGAYTGVAPAAHILDVRVADAAGGSDLVRVLEGLQSVAEHPEARVLNLSLSSGSPLPYQVDPLTVALEALWERGVTVVVPAGNDGPDRRTIASPGVDPLLVTSGSLDEHGSADRAGDTVAAWSSAGPAPQGVAKPDLVAPGTHLVSLRVPGSVIDREHPQARVGDSYFRGSGTSFATAVTSGAAATLLSARDLVPDQVKAVLTGSAYRVRGLRHRNEAGAGGLDLAAALATPTEDIGAAQEHPEAIPGDPAVWQSLVDALDSGDAEAVASSWSLLGAEARNWAARNWAASSWSARNWAASSWSARNWAARNWSARNWAEMTWAARNWSARNWAASSWSARNWSSSSWSSSSWSSSSWSSSSWSSSSWSARNWSSSSWSSTSWS